MKLLLEYGAEVSLLYDVRLKSRCVYCSIFLIVSKRDASSLYYIASKHGFAGIVKLLVEYGIQVNLPYNVNGAKNIMLVLE